MTSTTKSPTPTVETAWNRQSILEHMRKNDVRFLRLQFTELPVCLLLK